MKILLFFVFSLIACSLSSKTLSLSPSQDLFLITMPKSGTHLFMKFWYLLTEQYPHPYPFYNQAPDENFVKQYSWQHFPLPIHHLEKILSNPNTVEVITIRDPRDICVSLIHHILTVKLTNDESRRLYKERDYFKSLTFDEQLSYVIRTNNANLPFYSICPYYYINQVLSVLKDPRVCVCRFEDLVGYSGGGSKELQTKQILTVAEKFKLTLSREQLDFISDNLFGKTSEDKLTETFRQGQIGSWKSHFTSYHKELFKQLMGQDLIDLGYESDYNW